MRPLSAACSWWSGTSAGLTERRAALQSGVAGRPRTVTDAHARLHAILLRYSGALDQIKEVQKQCVEKLKETDFRLETAKTNCDEAKLVRGSLEPSPAADSFTHTHTRTHDGLSLIGVAPSMVILGALAARAHTAPDPCR